MFTADTIFYNGNIYTMKEEGDTVSAIVVYDEKILDMGTDEEMLKYPAKQIVDLHGKTVLPGFIDTHCHIAEAVEGQLKVDLTGITTIEEVISKMKGALPYVSEGKWLMGYQISERGIGRLPTRYELDDVSKDIPVYISDNGLHSFIGNSKLLEIIGVDKDFDKPGSQFIERDEYGEPDGIFREHGMLKYINANRPSAFDSDEHMKEQLIKKLHDWSAYGYTTLHSCDGFSGSPLDEMKVYQELRRDDRLDMRVILNKQNAVKNEAGIISGGGDNYVKYGAFKVFTDGSFSGRSALLIDDYADAPGNKGRTAHSFEEYRALIKEAYEQGDDIAIHVIGDGGMEWVLKVIEEIYDPQRKQQFELIHVSLTNEEQWERLSRYPVVIATQPIFLPDMEHSRRFRLGEERGNHLMAYKSWMKHGIKVAGGEDGPIYSSNPFYSMFYAITRYIREGVYLNPDEAVSRYEAVEMYTKNAAFCAHEEDIKGTIEPGKLADLCMFDKDIFKVDIQEFMDMEVSETYLGGRKVY